MRSSILALLHVSALAANDESSMLQMPIIEKTMEAEGDASECHCPGYFKEQCEAEASQGCMWSDAGTSNRFWCQCDPNFQGTPPLFTHPVEPTPPPVQATPPPVGSAPPVQPTEAPVPVPVLPALQNEHENCWADCGSTGGFCDYCGTDGACCRQGWSTDPTECGGLGGGLGSAHHSCRVPVPVTEPEPAGPALQNEDENCWSPCGSQGGYCDYCGTEGACCREGWDNDPEECGGLGGGLGSNHHSCRALVVAVTAAPEPVPDLRNENENCWGPCGHVGGFCEFCGADGTCCRGGWGGDPAECGGLGGGLGNAHHSCRAPVYITLDFPLPDEPQPVPIAPVTAAPEPNDDGVIAVVGPPINVLIDNSETNTKCVTAPVPVFCADDAGHLGNRLNSHQAGDTFDITVDGDQVCATRTDSGVGWGMHLEISCFAAPVHILIDSSTENTKCVTHYFPVTCAGDAGHLGNRINSHQAGDTFDITTSGNEICATRTDSGAGWGMHLELACVAATEEELEGPIVSAPSLNVLIDNSIENVKCVSAPYPVVCANDAGHMGNRVNSHQAGDTFDITTDGSLVCARRTDVGIGWGMHLEITCVAAPVLVLIDSSTDNTKCVTASNPVICADDAGHLGNRVNTHQAGDTFEITSDGSQVCATRTDSDAGWGMHLEIVCVATDAPAALATNPDAVIAVAGPAVNVLIDSSEANTKCVTAPVPVICADDAGHLGNRLNSHPAGDTFEITVDGDQVCATRTDSGVGWGMHLEIPCVAAPVHILIDSSSEYRKCVTHSFPVTCAGDAGHLGNRINSHQAGDTFDITTSGNEICATRTDSSAGWGMHLEIACIAASQEELVGQIVSAPAINVLIDKSNQNIKCVDTAHPVVCASDSGHLGNRINTHQAGDTFEITTDGSQVCARRTDMGIGWGMHLEITCVAAPVRVLIDSSTDNTKCVPASNPVICADDAGHLGNRVNNHPAGDTFEITSDGSQVCATRTDSDAGWGMHLEIVCVATDVPPAPAPNPDAIVAVAGPAVNVLIDNSNDNTKCVTASVPVICANDAGHLGNRLNSHPAGDTFDITVDGDQVCATRTDSGVGWGMHLEISCFAAPVHILIDSSTENTKCVTHAFPVTCAGDAGHLGNRINSHQAGDTFDISTSGNDVCATRTDSGVGWGMHLEIACIAASQEELVGQIVSAPTLNVLIDNSNENIKCVDAPHPVVCASDAGHLGNRVNTHQAGDAFMITTDGSRVCAQRTDHNAGWGMHLEITCVAAPLRVLIDNSPENTKCITAAFPVTCADDAGHLGNRVNTHPAGDTFEITSNGQQVCATRTDSNAGWGMHLEIVCVASGDTIDYIGCFADDGARDLQQGPKDYGYNSISCREACSEYSFFGLQHNGQCFCGNAYATNAQYFQVPDGQCGHQCAGDDQLCGGAWRNAVYSTGRPQAEEDLVFSYIGCFVDDGSRDLEIGPRAYGYNSQGCNEACSDYSFFALQNNGWCVCGDAYSTASQYQQVGDNQCGATCANDDGLCGAGWRNAVYRTGRHQPVAARSYAYIGCFVDDGSRDLEIGPRAYGYTSETCSYACAEYPFYALQNNGWCVCGNDYGTASQYGQVGDSECGNVCSGDDQLCGAGWRNAVYSTGLPRPVGNQGEYSYIGCFVDDGGRDLEQGPRDYWYQAGVRYNSVTCNQACTDLSFPFFALQNNGWCVCGDAYATASQYNQVDDGQCGSYCAGDDERCGAGWRNAVFRTGLPQSDESRQFSYVGCYVDDGTRDLEQGPMAYGYTSVTCNQACSDYDYFALQNNGWCVCGDAYSTEDQYIQKPDLECGANCAGDDQRCGAGWRNAVFSRV